MLNEESEKRITEVKDKYEIQLQQLSPGLSIDSKSSYLKQFEIMYNKCVNEMMDAMNEEISKNPNEEKELISLYFEYRGLLYKILREPNL